MMAHVATKANCNGSQNKLDRNNYTKVRRENSCQLQIIGQPKMTSQGTKNKMKNREIHSFQDWTRPRAPQVKPETKGSRLEPMGRETATLAPKLKKKVKSRVEKYNKSFLLYPLGYQHLQTLSTLKIYSTMTLTDSSSKEDWEEAVTNDSPPLVPSPAVSSSESRASDNNWKRSTSRKPETQSISTTTVASASSISPQHQAIINEEKDEDGRIKYNYSTAEEDLTFQLMRKRMLCFKRPTCPIPRCEFSSEKSNGELIWTRI